MNIFLLIGQSNMAGRGKLAEVPALRHPQVFCFRNGKWCEAIEPLHPGAPEGIGVGLAMSFALRLVNEPGMPPVGLVPCAVGGTPLSRWMPGMDLYDHAVSTARAATSDGCLRGILWHQGERDAARREDAETYAERLLRMFAQLRLDLKAEAVPIVAGGLGHFLARRDDFAFFEMVNRGLRELGKSLPRYACISSLGLKDNGDAVHFDAGSLREFGDRYASRWIEMNRNDRWGEFIGDSSP